MPIYNQESRVSEPILYDPSIIPVINRFGISLGVGDKTIKEVCSEKCLDCEFFLAVINTYLNSDYFPEDIVKDIHLELLLTYLEQTDLYYKNVQLPNIERHFSLLINSSGAQDGTTNSNLGLLRRFYNELQEEMNNSINNDLNYWFPLYKIGQSDNIIGRATPFENTLLEEKLSDLISFFVIHLKGDYNKNLCVAVVTAICNLLKDVRQNNRIRDRILKPLCQELG